MLVEQRPVQTVDREFKVAVRAVITNPHPLRRHQLRPAATLRGQVITVPRCCGVELRAAEALHTAPADLLVERDEFRSVADRDEYVGGVEHRKVGLNAERCRLP